MIKAVIKTPIKHSILIKRTLLVLALQALLACGGGSPSTPVVANNTTPVADNKSNNAIFSLSTSKGNQILSLHTTLTVPKQPPATGTLFLWPGLQPNGDNFLPIDNGVLQPVLTWGPSCAPGTQPTPYSTWWISAQYVNTYGHAPNYTGCLGGPVMSVNVGDKLDIDMRLDGSNWLQTIKDPQTNQSVSFQIDMKGQTQNIALFLIEGYQQIAVGDVIFSNTKIHLEKSEASFCKLGTVEKLVSVSTPVATNAGFDCEIASIVLRSTP